MLIIGCDYHPGLQQIAFVDSETGALPERRLQHRRKGRRFTANWQRKPSRCGWGWKLLDMRAGLSDCWGS